MSNLELARKKLSFLEQQRILATDPSAQFNLDFQILELKQRIAEMEGREEPAVVSNIPAKPQADPAPAPMVVKEAPAQPKSPSPVSSKFPWWAVSLLAGLAAFLLLWWVIGQPKLALLLGAVITVFLLLRDPDRFFMTITYSCLGLLSAINIIDPSGFVAGEGENLRFRIELSEPSVWVSLFLIVLMGWSMYLQARRA